MTANRPINKRFLQRRSRRCPSKTKVARGSRKNIERENQGGSAVRYNIVSYNKVGVYASGRRERITTECILLWGSKGL